MSDAEIDQEQLIKELIAESFALRTKSEHLSQYVETKIADLVKTRSELSTIRGESGRLKSESEREIERLKSESEREIGQLKSESEREIERLKSESEREIGQLKSESEREIGQLKSESEREIRRLRAGIETANQQRNELQDKLDSLISEHEALGEANLQMTSQRDRLRNRMAQVDASPEYRLAKRLRRILGVILKDAPSQ